MLKNARIFLLLSPSLPVPFTGGRVNNEEVDQKRPGDLPEDVDLDTSSKDLLLRLLDVDPKKRLHSLRTLQTIAFYKGYNFDDVKNKKVKPNDILQRYESPKRNVVDEDHDFFL